MLLITLKADKIPTPKLKQKLATEPNKSKLKLKQQFMNEIIANKKDINGETFWNYLKYQNPSFLAKDLIRATHSKNDQLVNDVNDELIDLRNIIKK